MWGCGGGRDLSLPKYQQADNVSTGSSDRSDLLQDDGPCSSTLRTHAPKVERSKAQSPNGPASLVYFTLELSLGDFKKKNNKRPGSERKLPTLMEEMGKKGLKQRLGPFWLSSWSSPSSFSHTLSSSIPLDPAL